MPIHLPDDLASQLSAIAQKYGARRLVLFGSRARGDHRPRSDIDLAIYDMPEENRGAFWLEVEKLTPEQQELVLAQLKGIVDAARDK